MKGQWKEKMLFRKDTTTVDQRQKENPCKKYFICPLHTSNHSWALREPDAADNIQPFTFHQIPPLTTSLVSEDVFI